jgi:hypothetical protein
VDPVDGGFLPAVNEQPAAEQDRPTVRDVVGDDADDGDGQDARRRVEIDRAAEAFPEAIGEDLRDVDALADTDRARPRLRITRPVPGRG